MGTCKRMYENHAFGDAALTWEAVEPDEATVGDPTRALEWLRAAHQQLRASIAALNDGDLDQPRRANWGEMYPARWLIIAMLQHDLYHSGEINHIRSLRRGDDRWQHERESS